MNHVVRRIVLAAALVAAAGCAQDDVVGQDAVAGTAPLSVVEGSTTTALAGDLGSRYVGSPVAFWFWAPY